MEMFWRTRCATRLLGAAGLGDIGTHFPDTDPEVEGREQSDLFGARQEIAG